MRITPQVIFKTKEKVKDLKNNANKAEQLDTFEQYSKQLKYALEEFNKVDKANTPELLDKFSSVMANYYLLSQKKEQLEDEANKLFFASAEDFHSENGKQIEQTYQIRQKESEEATQVWEELGNQINVDCELKSDSELNYTNTEVYNALDFDAKEEAKIKEQIEKERHVDFDKENLEAFCEVNTKYFAEKDQYSSYADYAKQHMDASQKSGDLAQNKKECLGFYPKLKNDYDKKNWFLKIFAFKERSLLKTIKNNLTEYKVDVSKLDSYKGYVDKRFGLDKSDFGSELTVPDVVNDAKKENVVESSVKDIQKDDKELNSTEELLGAINQDLKVDNTSLEQKSFDTKGLEKANQKQNNGMTND